MNTLGKSATASRARATISPLTSTAWTSPKSFANARVTLPAAAADFEDSHFPGIFAAADIRQVIEKVVEDGGFSGAETLLVVKRGVAGCDEVASIGSRPLVPVRAHLAQQTVFPHS